MIYLACIFGGASLGLLTAAILISGRLTDNDIENALRDNTDAEDRAEWAERH